MYRSTQVRDDNPNYYTKIIPMPTSDPSDVVPASFPFGKRPTGMPVVSPTTTTTSSTTTSTRTDVSGITLNKRPNVPSSDEPDAKRAKLSSNEEHENTKLTVRKKLLKQFLRDIELYSNKAGEPWYEFAALYASAMGGLVKTDDLIACYPYDFYTPSLWEKRALYKNDRTRGTTNVDDAGVIDIDEEEAREKNVIEITDKKSDKRRAIDALSKHIKEIVGSHFSQHTDASSLEAILRASSAYIIDLLVQREIKEEDKSKRAKEEEEIMGKLKDLQTQVQPYMAPSSSLSSPTKAKYLKSLVKDEAAKISRIGPVSRRRVDLDIDIDDDVLYPSNAIDDDDEFRYEISKTMGLNIFNPEFKALITMCTDDINGLSDGPNRNFTSYELCMSPVVRTQFAKFMALCTAPVNNKFSTKTPFATQSYASNYSGSNGGNTIIVQPAQTRYVMAANKVEVQALYQLFKRVRRRSDGVLVLQNKSSESLDLSRANARLNGYGRPVSDEYDENDDYDAYAVTRAPYYRFGVGATPNGNARRFNRSNYVPADYVL